MKKLLLAFVLLLSVGAYAQDKTRNISLELFGAQNTIGVNYDSRFKGNDGWGYRVGIGYGYGKTDFEETKGVGCPLEINYLLGKKKSKLELGFGASIGIYNVTDLIFNSPDDSMFGYLLFGDIGYRYQPTSGFVFRIGVSPSFNFGDEYGLEKSTFYPYIGFGWAF